MKRARAALAWAGVVVLLAVAAGLIGWRVEGGSWVRVQTASMGTQAPVGTLLWIEKVPFDRLRAGDLITFRPDGSSSTYSHLVDSVNDDGTVSTRGRITGVDPWRIRPDQVVGRAAMVWPGVGWLVLAAPALLGGAAIVGLLVSALRDRSLRLPVAVLGGAVVLTVTVVTYRPLVGAEQISFTTRDGRATATYVGTGLLPVRLSAPDAVSVVLASGEVGSVTTAGEGVGSDQARFAVDLGPAVPMWWWVALVLACLAPAAIETLGRFGIRLAPSRPGTVGGRHLAIH